MEGGPQSYLIEDYSVDCNSERYRIFEGFACIMIIIYPVGIPAMYYVLLTGSKAILSDPKEMAREAANEKVPFPRVGHLTFLTDSYKPEYYYFESLECSEAAPGECRGNMPEVFAPVIPILSKTHDTNAPRLSLSTLISIYLLCRPRRFRFIYL